MKQVSIDKYIKQFKGDDYKDCELKIGKDTVTVKIKPYLSYVERQRFIEEYVNTCFSYDEETGDFLSYDVYCQFFAKQIFLIKFYTNIKISEDVMGYYNLLHQSDVYDQILKYIDYAEWDDLCCDLEEMINFKKQQILSNERYEDLFNKMAQIEQMLDVLGKFSLEPKDTQRIVDALASLGNTGYFTPENVINAIALAREE